MAIEQFSPAQGHDVEFNDSYNGAALGADEKLEINNYFEPEDELQRIRDIGGGEGLEELEKLRAQLLENKEQLASFQEEIVEFIRQNQDMPIGDIVAYALTYAQEYEFSKLQQSVITEALDKYAERHDIVERLRRDYPENNLLYKHLFGREPEGKVEVVEGPMNLMLRCYDLDDFAYVDSYKWLEKDSTLTIADRADSWNTLGLSLEEFDGTMLLENSSLVVDEELRQATFTHEEQHAIAKLFDETTRDFEQDISSEGILEQLRQESNDDERFKLLAQYFGILRFQYENMAGDELLAQVAGGVEADQELVNLLSRVNGIYDYARRKGSVLDRWRLRAEQALGDQGYEMVEPVVDQVFSDEYRQQMTKAVEAIRTLSFYGYSTSKIIGLLLHEPLQGWFKIVQNIVAPRPMQPLVEND